MKIALDHTSEIGVRAGRLLLGEPDLDLLGVVRRDVKDRDPRLRRIDDLSGFDAVVTDDPASTILAEAAASGVPCVLWADSVDRPIETTNAAVLVGSNLVEGIGRSLVARELDGAGDDTRLLFAWTEPGKPIRRGEAVTFPDPIGARWGSRRSATERRLEIAVPVPDEWAGIVVSTWTEEASTTVGIADLATHLESIALAAGAVVAAAGLL
ncbi:MAG TPA: hypothetical protein VFD97_09335, partial [Acidimicrobiia bacterium]|nr:hypothetical protein [Acidimicrobiia bacterium]